MQVEDVYVKTDELKNENSAPSEQTDNSEKKKKKSIKDFFLFIKSMIQMIKDGWDVPPKGRYIPYKEFFFFCLGGMGIYTATMFINYLNLDAGMHLAAALEITPREITYIAIINIAISIARAPLISYIVDNTKSKYGKFRPYLIWLPIPMFLLIVAVGWLPYIALQSGNKMLMLVLFTIISNLFAFLMAIYTLAFATLIQVISPSPEERTTLMSVGAFVYSLGPSILNLFFPIIANIAFAVKGPDNLIKIAGYNRIGTFKWILPGFALAFFLLGYLCSLKCKERIVKPKGQVLKVKFFKGIKLTFKNKYFWIFNISQAAVAIRILALGVLVAWGATYVIKNNAALGLANTFVGMAYVPGMLLAPLLIKKFGKKKLQLFSNFASAIGYLILLFIVVKPVGEEYAVWQGYLMVTGAFFITFILSVQTVTIPAMGAQMYDYQQYKTGDRLEGFLSQFGGIIITLFTAFALVLKNFLIDKNGIAGDYSLLNEAKYLSPILRALLVASIAGGIICGLPFFFWDLTEKKHRSIMDVLKIRAGCADGRIDENLAKELEAKVESGEEGIIEKYLPDEEENKKEVIVD